MTHLVTPDGTRILPGTMLHAVQGPHSGTHWRLEELFHNGTEHMLRCSRFVSRIGRVVMALHPSVFGLSVMEEAEASVRHSVEWLRSAYRETREGLIMGFLALIPLAIFEGLHGAEHAHVLLSLIFGGGGE